MERVTGRQLSSPTVREWFQQWLDGKVGANAPSTLIRYRRAVADFLTFLGPKADRRLEAVDQRDIIDFRNSFLADGKTATTANLMIGKIVAAPFRLAFNQGIIAHNPIAGLPRLKDRGRKRKGAFTLDQVRSLVSAADGEWKGAILLGFTSGMRLSDVANLAWDNIDQENRVLHFRQGKTQSIDDEETVLGLHPDFEDYLKGLKVRALTGPVFPSLAGCRSSGSSGLSAQFRRIMAQAGIQPEIIRSRTGKGQTVRALSFHSLRHSAASRIFSAKVVEESVKRQTGHAGESHRTYIHADIPAIRAACQMIPRL